MNDEEEMVAGPVDIDVVGVKALEGFRIWVKLSNGIEGELDLTPLASKPWFEPWADRKIFEDVRIPPHGRDIRWGDDGLDRDMVLCIIWLYTELTGNSWEDLQRETRPQLVNA